MQVSGRVTEGNERSISLFEKSFQEKNAEIGNHIYNSSDHLSDGWDSNQTFNAKDIIRSRIMSKFDSFVLKKLGQIKDERSKQVLQPMIARDSEMVRDIFKQISQIIAPRSSNEIRGIKLIELVSETGCSKLYKAFDKANDKVVYLKIFELKDEQDNNEAYEELNIYHKVVKSDDPLLMRIIGTEIKIEKRENQTTLFLLIEGGNGSLKDNSEYRTMKGHNWSDQELLNIFEEIIIQTKRLYDLGIYSRDIKPEHLIITNRGIKIIDFAHACSRFNEFSKLSVAGTLWYLAPELIEAHKKLINRTDYNPVVTDSYSIALTMLRILDMKIEQKEKLILLMQKNYLKLFEYLRDMMLEDEMKRLTYITLFETLKLSNLMGDYENKEQEIDVEISDFLQFIQKNTIKKSKPSEILSMLVIYNSLDEEFDFREALEELKPDGNKYDELKPREKMKLHETIARHSLKIEDVRKALSNYCKSLENQVIVYGKEHINVALTHMIIGGLYLSLEEYERSIEHYNCSLQIKEKIGANGLDNTRGILLFDIGIAYEKTGNNILASKAYEEAVHIFEEIHGKDHPSVAAAYNYLGGTQEQLGKYREAFTNFKTALEIRLRLYSNASHPSVGVSYNNLGLICEKLAEYKRALEYYQKALEIWNKCYDKTNEKVATTLNNIGSAYDNLKDYAKAQEFYKKSLDLRIKLFGEDHRSVGQSYNNLGTVYYFLKNYDKANDYYSKALRIWTNVYGTSHIKIATLYNNLASVYRALEKRDQAKNYFDQCLEIKMKLFGPDHPSVATTLVSLGEISFLDNKDKALEYFERALEIRKKDLGKNHPQTQELDNIVYKFKKNINK